MIHITSTYQFVLLPPDVQTKFKEDLEAQAYALGLKGTILVSKEGINITVAGTSEAIVTFKQILSIIPDFKPWFFKDSTAQVHPFKKLKVRIKKSVISMKDICLSKSLPLHTYLSPHTLYEWYQNQVPFVLLDVRNHYEVALGTFEGAIDLKLKKFSEFPQAIDDLTSALKNKTLVTFCTGGIRCEKATLYLLEAGFEQAYQLEGGILAYLAHYGSNYFKGECFVFDHRGVAPVHTLLKPEGYYSHGNETAKGS